MRRSQGCWQDDDGIRAATTIPDHLPMIWDSAVKQLDFVYILGAAVLAPGQTSPAWLSLAGQPLLWSIPRSPYSECASNARNVFASQHFVQLDSGGGRQRVYIWPLMRAHKNHTLVQNTRAHLTIYAASVVL